MKTKISTLIVYIVLIIFSIVTLFPFVYMILTGLMTHQELSHIPPTIIPEKLQWHNYLQVFKQVPFLNYFVNTLFVATMTTFLTLITCTLAAFALTSLQFKFKKLVFGLLIGLLMVPYESIIFTNYNTILQLGLKNTYVALIIPFMTSIFYIYFLNNYMKAIPDSLYKAAKVDGASNLEYIRRILVPIISPALVTVGILSFIMSWNSFLWPLLVTDNDNMRLLNNGLAAFATEAGAQTQLQMAAATLTVLPVLVLYFVFRKQIIRGVARNGIKG
ncbi:MAG: carbohydrate ABC transporter permease [Streptococcaceae bacterium]|jgi:multiple sugar transport system permease protein|nr:carbohydrate ABC transporter permease [Streptococcaceae bacterium]